MVRDLGLSRRKAYIDKASAELAELSSAGCVMAGNAFSQILLVKGALTKTDRSKGLLSGRDGVALRAALTALGYAPEDWVALAVVDDGGQLLDATLFRQAVATLDPSTMVALDEIAANLVRDAYAEDLVSLTSLSEAMLDPGLVVPVAGMRAMALDGFEDALDDPRRKQFMWACLKRLPPLGEPY